MRRQDEILEQYEQAEPSFRRVLLDLAGDLGPVYDSGRLQALLRESLSSSDTWTRAIAMLSCLEFESSWVPARLRVSGPAAGTWTTLHLAKPDASAVSAAATDPRTRNSELRRALHFRLSPAIEVLAARLERLPPAARIVGLLCLSRTPTRSSAAALGRVLAETRHWEAALALAAMGTEFSHGPLLDYLGSENGSKHPQALAGLRFLGSTRPPKAPRGPHGGRTEGSAIEPAARRGDRTVAGSMGAEQPESEAGEEALAAQWNRLSRARATKLLEGASRDPDGNVGLGAALALAGFPESCDSIGQRLARRPEPGLAAHVLVAIARAGDGLGALRAIHEEATNPFLQVLVVRAAGAIASPAAEELLRQIVEEGSGPARALALELAARARPALPGELLARLLSAEAPRVRLNAALAWMEREPDRALPTLKQLVGSPEARERRAGVFALAYVQGEAAAKVLEHFLGDPDPGVRFEAVSSLARNRSALAGTTLLEVALGPEASLAAQALQALAWWDGDGVAGLVQQLAEALAGRSDVTSRTGLLAALGGLAATTGRLPEGVLAADLTAEDPRLTAARADAMALAGVAPGQLARDASKRVQGGVPGARIALAELLAGNLEAVASLSRLLEDDDGSAPAIEALWQVLLLAPALGLSPRLRALEGALNGELRRPGCDDFALRELGVAGASGTWPGVRQPREADPDILRLSSSRSCMAPWAAELADAPRPGARPSGRVRPDAYYTVPRARRRGLLWGTAAVATGALVLWVSLGRESPAPAPVRPAVVRTATRARPQSLSFARHFGEIRTEPVAALRRGHLLAGEHVRVDAGEVELRGPYPSVRLVLSPGDLSLGACAGRAGGSLATDVSASVGPGSYRLDFRAARSGIELKAAGQTLHGRGCDFELEVGERGASLRVRGGTVRLTAPTGKEVVAGEEASWGGLPEARDRQ